MSRYYKPNNSTILYLHAVYNCIRSNSITITKTGNGSGYTSTPSVVIKPAPGDMGSGASATIAAPVSGVLSGALTMVNNTTRNAEHFVNFFDDISTLKFYFL